MVESSLTIFLITIFTAMISGSNTGGLHDFVNKKWTPPEGYNQVVCKSIDARNTVNTLRKLENCTILVGCLQMVFINNVPIDINDISFPMLREVTDYIYLYEVKGLRTLANLFPNLEVIGGRELIWNYALIIDQVPQLEEVGLYNLKTIRNGLVRIDNNPRACYLKTINWDKITSRPGNIIIQRAACKHQDSCAHCALRHCWNKNDCQILPPPATEEIKNCDPKCLTCSLTNRTSCYQCRYYSGEYSCLATCEGDRVILQIFNTSYCLTTQQCLALYGFVAGGVCLLFCPTPENRKIYEIDSLVPLIKNRCLKVCPYLYISSLGDLQKAVNCEVIQGFLQIRLYGDYEVTTMEDLRHNLRNIKVIRDYLKVYSTNVITSFSFLENLEVIQGKHLDMSSYSIVIHDMINLRHIFTDDGPKIESGDILAFDNPQLCLDEIHYLHRNLKKTVPKFEQIAYTSNGYSAMCHKKEIKPTHMDITYDSIIITFSRVTPWNNRKKYKIHFLQSDQKTPEGSLKDCQKIGWQTRTVDDVNSENLNITFKMSGLKELAYYTYYIESVSIYENYTHITDHQINKSHSHEITFQTAPKSIIPPLIVNMSSLMPNTLYVQWKDNTRQENLVHFYIFQLELIRDSLKIYDDMNFCRRPKTKHYNNQKLQAEYQSSLQNRCAHAECRKDATNIELDMMTIVNSLNVDNNQNILFKSKSFYKSLNVTNKRVFYRTVVNAPINNLTVKSLFDYGYYHIKIHGCTINNCSKAASSAKRIMRSDDADNVKVNGCISENKKLNLVWQEPAMPNGAILSYLVEFQQTSMGILEPINSNAPLRFCITRKNHQLNNYTFVIPHVSDVKYNVRIAAISLAGVGRFSIYSFSGPSAPYHVVLWPISFVFLIPLFGVAFLHVRRRRQERSHNEYRNTLIRISSETNL